MSTVLARARVVIEGDTVHINAALASAEARMRQTGERMAQVGRTLSTAFTLPIAGVGFAAVRMASSFDESMRKIVALTNTSSAQVEEWRDDVRSLAVEFGKSGTEAADALFFITGAGITGARAMEALRASLMGSAIGLGETKAVADAATSAMNAYQKTGLTATRATEILAAAVKEGKLEAANLAPVMGTVTGTSAALGISFEDVAGVLAIFSRTGTDAAEGATQLNSIMSTLLGTSEEGVKVLGEAGMSLDQLRSIAAGPGGLLTVMRMLDKELTLAQLRVVIPNIRAFRGVMNALAQDGPTVNAMLDGVRNSVGFLDKAMQASEGPAHKMRQAWAQIKDALIEVGDVLIPVVVPAVQAVGQAIRDAAGWFSKLSPAMQQATIIAAVFAAALGPILIILGNLIKTIAVFKVAAVTGFSGMAAMMGPIGIALALLTAGFIQMRMEVQRMEMATAAATARFNAMLGAASPQKAAKMIDGISDRIARLNSRLAEEQFRLKAAQDVQLNPRLATSLDAQLAARIRNVEAIQEEIAETQAAIAAATEHRDVLQGIVDAHQQATAVAAPAAIVMPTAVAPEAVQEAMKALRDSLREVMQTEALLGVQFDETAARAAALEEGIKALIAAGAALDARVGPNGETLRQLSVEMQTLQLRTMIAEDQQRRFNDRMAEARSLVAAAQTPLEIYTHAVQILVEAAKQGEIGIAAMFNALNKALKDMQSATAGAVDKTNELKQGLVDMAGRAVDAFVDFTSTARQSFSEFVTQALQDIVRLIIKMQLLSFISSALGIGGKKVGVKGFAGGGFLHAGGFGIVGETGPELISGGRSGVRVTPMPARHAGGGEDRMTVPVQISVHAIDSQDVAKFFERNTGLISDAMLRAAQRSNALRRRLGG